MPVFKPKPTPVNDRMAPPADKESSVFLPNRCKTALGAIEVAKKANRTSIKKMGGNVIATLTTVIPREM